MSQRTEPTSQRQNRPLQIGLIYPFDARDVRTWSGTPFFVKRALEKHVGDVTDLSPYPGANRLMRLISAICYRLGRPAPYDHLVPYAWKLGRYFSRRLRSLDLDCIVAPGGAEGVAWLQTDLPVILYSDATWDLVVDYYRVYNNLLPGVKRSGEIVESRALERSALLLYSSQWAADSAIKHYGIPSDRVIVPYIGANLLDPPKKEEVLPRTMTTGVIRLLMVGVDWQNKGGSVARRVLEGLIERGYQATLTVAGCTVPDSERHPAMEVVPFLNKSIPDQRARFEELWRDADLFILPSRFEAAGLVFCEASAYGLPIVAADTGGISSLVREGKNGYTIGHEDEPEGYIERIIGLAEDPEAYGQLAVSARAEFDERLNWDTWGRTVGEQIRRVLGE